MGSNTSIANIKGWADETSQRFQVHFEEHDSCYADIAPSGKFSDTPHIPAVYQISEDSKH